MRRLTAVIDDDAGVRSALDSLQQAGVDVTKVNVLSGPEGARLLDRTGTGHGLRARLLRTFQKGAFEGEALETHDRALNHGHHVLFVPVRNEEQLARFADILRSAGGHHLLRFRMWSIEILWCAGRQAYHRAYRDSTDEPQLAVAVSSLRPRFANRTDGKANVSATDRQV